MNIKTGTKVNVYQKPITLEDFEEAGTVTGTPVMIGDVDVNGNPLYRADVQYSPRGGTYSRIVSEIKSTQGRDEPAMIPAPPDPCEHVNLKNVGPDPDGGGPDRIYCRDCDTLVIVTWAPCDYCDEYVCNYHVGQHAHDCTCPAIDQWVEYDLFPYTAEPADKVARFLEAVQYEEPES